VTENGSSRVWRKMSGELWSTNYKGHVSLHRPKSTFSGDSDLSCTYCALTGSEVDQVLLAHTTNGDGSPQVRYQPQPLHYLAKKLVNFGPQTKKFYM